MTKEDFIEIAYKNGYNSGIRNLLKAQKTTQIVLSMLVAVSIILSTFTFIKTIQLSNETHKALSEMAAQIETTTKEFKNLAYRIERLEEEK